MKRDGIRRPPRLILELPVQQAFRIVTDRRSGSRRRLRFAHGAP
jgi:hypothetical protein